MQIQSHGYQTGERKRFLDPANMYQNVYLMYVLDSDHVPPFVIVKIL